MSVDATSASKSNNNDDDNDGDDDDDDELILMVIIYVYCTKILELNIRMIVTRREFKFKIYARVYLVP